MVLVGAGLCGDVDLTHVAPVFRRINAVLHFEFLQRVDRRQQKIIVEVIVCIVQTVERVVVELGALPGNTDGGGGAQAALNRGLLPGRSKSIHNIGAQRHQLKEFPAIQWQVRNSLRSDHGAHRDILSTEKWRRG